jgi:hypothetical protein
MTFEIDKAEKAVNFAKGSDKDMMRLMLLVL